MAAAGNQGYPRAMARTAVLGALVLALFIPAPAHAGRGCVPPGAKVIAQDDGRYVMHFDGGYFACHSAVGKLHPLWVHPDTRRVTEVRFAGRWVGYGHYWTPRSCRSGRVGVRSINLRTGARGKRIPSTKCSSNWRYAITDAVVNGLGSIAAIRSQQSTADGHYRGTVLRSDTRGITTLDHQRETKPDSGTPLRRAIVPGSLERSGKSVYWERVDGVRRATLR